MWVKTSFRYLILLIRKGGSKLDFEGGGLYGLFHVRHFLTILFAIGNIAVWASMSPQPSGSAPVIKYMFTKLSNTMKLVLLIMAGLFSYRNIIIEAGNAATEISRTRQTRLSEVKRG